MKNILRLLMLVSLLSFAVPAGAQVTTAGYAVRLDGTNDYLSVPAGQINLANSSFTIELWAKRERTGPEFVVGQGTGEQNKFLHIGFRDLDAFSFNFWANDFATEDVYRDQDWHHWACTYNATTRVRMIYRDGVQVGSDVASANFQGTGEFHIGEAFGFFFKGQVDDLRVWNVVRTEAAIRVARWHPWPGGFNPGLVALYTFDQPPGQTTALDSSGNNRHATLTNGVSFVVSTAPIRLAHRLAFTTSPQTLSAGTASGIISVQRQNLPSATWEPVTADGDLQVNLSSSSTTGVFRNAADTTSITSVVIPFGQSSVSFRYRDSLVGSPAIMASSPEMTSAGQTETVNASTKLVTTLGDSGPGSLRQAILDMNATGAETIINFGSVTGIIVLQSPLPIIEQSLILHGPGATQLTISGNNLHRIFFIDAPGKTVQIEGVRLANGRAKGGDGGAGWTGGGGGLGAGGAMFVNAGDVRLIGVSFSQNRAIGGNGGAVLFDGGRGGGGGGGLGGNGGAGEGLAGGGGGGFGGNGGSSFSLGGGGGGGRVGNGAAGATWQGVSDPSFSHGGGGGGTNSATSRLGGAGGGGDGGGGTSDMANPDGVDGEPGQTNGGGGGGGQRRSIVLGLEASRGGAGGRFGGGGGAAWAGGPGGEFGGGGGTQSLNGGQPSVEGGGGGFGGGGGAGHYDGRAGVGGFGGGGGGSVHEDGKAAAGPFGGSGGYDNINSPSYSSYRGAGGGGGALGGAIFVRSNNGATITLTDCDTDAGTVTPGVKGAVTYPDTLSYAANGSSAGSSLFLLGGTTALSVQSGSKTISGSIGGWTNSPASIVKNGAGTLILAGTSTYPGNTTIDAGTLQVEGNIATSTNVLVKQAGATLSGAGTVGKLSLAPGGTLSPGSAVGVLHAGNTTWTGDSSYVWQIHNASGAAGLGYDLLDINGTLDVSGANGFMVHLFSYSSIAPLTFGAATNFDNTKPGAWTIVQTSGGIAGFDSSKFSVLTVGFANSLNGGRFALEKVGNNLVLKFYPRATVAWAAPAGITYGTPLSSTQLNATANVPGNFTYSPNMGAVLDAGTRTVTVTFVPTDTVNYSTVTAAQTLAVLKATPVVNWAADPIPYGTPLGATQLNASANVPGTFIYTPGAGALLDVGTQILSARFTPTDTTNYNTVDLTCALQVNKLNSILDWGFPHWIAYGTPLGGSQLNATANVPGTFIYTPPAGTILDVGGPVLRVDFYPTDSAHYLGNTAFVPLIVSKAHPTITWTTPSAITYGTPLSGTQLNASLDVPGTPSYTPLLGTILNAGTNTLSVTFTPDLSRNYDPVSAFQSLVVSKANPTITWGMPSPIVYGTALSAAQLNAAAEGLPGVFSYAPDSGLVLDAGTNTLSLTFTPSDTNNYNIVTVTRTLVVSKATPVIAWPVLSNIVYGTALSETQLSASAGVPGTFSYTPVAGTVLNAGTNTLTALFTPTAATNYQTVNSTNSLVVAKASQTITFPVLPSKRYGDPPFTLSATASSGLPITFSVVSGQAQITGNVVTLTGGGGVVVSAVQAGNSNYLSAFHNRAFGVAKALLTVTADNVSRDFGTSNPIFTATFSGFVNGDTISAITGAPAFSTTATLSSVQGAYPIAPSLGTLASTKYAFTFVNGVLTVRNTPPFANPQSVTLNEDTPTAVTLTGADPDGSVLTFLIKTTPTYGTLSGTPPNLTYIPRPNLYGADSFTFATLDGEFESAPATVTLTINSVPDAPTMASVSDKTMLWNSSLWVPFSINDADRTWSSLTVAGFSSNETLVPNTTNALSLRGAGSNRRVVITPATNQVGTSTITLTVNDGALSASRSFLLTVTNSAGSSVSGTGLDGYIANARVFFDANRNGLQDANEPGTNTDGQGHFNFAVANELFDQNQNGSLDAEEGRLALNGGTDIATGLAFTGFMTAPLDATVITPLTTMLVELQNQNPALTGAQAELLLVNALGIPNHVSSSVNLRQYDPFDAALIDDPNAVEIQNASAKVHDTILQTSALLQGAASPPGSQVNASVTRMLAAQILAAGQADLSEAGDVKALITQSAAALNIALPIEIINGAATVIAEVNQAKDEVLSTGLGAPEALIEITRAQHVAQAEVAADLAAVGSGAVAVDDVVLARSGQQLMDAIQAAPVGDLTGFDINPGIILFSRKEFQVREGGIALQAVTLNRVQGARGEVTALVTWGDGTAQATSGDYISSAIEVRFADGEISKIADLANRIATDGQLEGNETIQLSVALAAGAPAGAAVGLQSSATLTVVDADSTGTFALSQSEFEVRENGAEPNTVTIARTGGTVGSVTLLVTPNAMTGGATPGADFPITPISVTFAPGAQYRRVVIPVVRDFLAEGNERFEVTLSLAADSPSTAMLGNQSTATATILDTPNTAPAATARSIVALEDTALELTLTGQDAEDDSLSFAIVNAPGQGVLVGTPPNLIYVPSANFNGSDSFTFKANDGLVDSAPATISLAVTPINDAPVMANAIAGQAGIYGSPFTFTIPSGTFVDVDAGQTLDYSASGLPPGLTLVPASLTLSGTPMLAGNFTVALTVTDSGTPALSAAASFAIAIARAPLSVSASNVARDYGQQNPPLTGTLAGIANNDKITATYDTAATTTSPVGEYPVVPSLFDLENKLGNYTLTKNNGTITVRNVPPVVNAGPDQEKVAGDEVAFAGSFTDPSSPAHVVGWDFGDGSAPVLGTLTPKHVFAKSGVYTVKLAVTDTHLASASDTLTVTVVSSYGSVSDALERLKPFVKESRRVEKIVKDLAASLEPKYWVDEMHLNPKGGNKAFVYCRQSADMMEQLLKPSKKRENDPQDANDGEDDDEFKKIFHDPNSDTLSAGAFKAVDLSLSEVIRASRLISETLYLENEGLTALDPRKQKRVDAALARGKEYLEDANGLVAKGDYGPAVRRYIRSWNNTQDAIDIAGQSQPAKELIQAQALIEESLDPKNWVDEMHLDVNTGARTFNQMQSAARELANVVADAEKGRVIAATGQMAQAELADLLARVRGITRTLYLENAALVAVRSTNQKSVDSNLKQAKEDLDKALEAEAEEDFDKALNLYASSWDNTTKAIEHAAKTK